LLTPHPGGLDYDLNHNQQLSIKNDKVLNSTAALANLFGNFWKVQKRGLPIVNTFH
jgi:hypothetical protein